MFLAFGQADDFFLFRKKIIDGSLLVMANNILDLLKLCYVLDFFFRCPVSVLNRHRKAQSLAAEMIY